MQQATHNKTLLTSKDMVSAELVLFHSLNLTNK